MRDQDLEAVDPELRPLLELLQPVVLTAQNLDEVRLDLTRRVLESRGVADDLDVTDQVIKVPGASGDDLALFVHTPAQRRSGGVVLHLHGGGMVMGSADIVASANRQTAHDLGVVVVSVDYRLAPEHPYPAALDDARTALAWINAHADVLGVDASCLVLKGESAGGGLAAALALSNRDTRQFAIRHLHLMYPMLDDRTCARPRPALAGRFVWTPAANEFGWRSYLGVEPGSESVPNHASPGREDDLSGMPPSYVAVGSLDLFCKESVSFAADIIMSGGTAELHVYPGAFHSFASFGSAADVAMRANRDSLRALRAACESAG